MSILEIAATVTALTVIGTAIIWLCKATYTGVRALRAWYVGLSDLVEKFKPNGGSSLKDTLTRIDCTLQRNTARLLALQDYEPRAIFECDAEGKCTFVNKQLCKLFGMDPADMLGTGWLLGVPEVERSGVWDNWAESIKNTTPYEATYHVRNRRTDVTRNYRTNALPMVDQRGNLLGYHGLVELVSEDS